MNQIKTKILKNVISIFLFSLAASVFGQTKISYSGTGTFILRERTNLRKYVNGKYEGLVSREVSSYILPTYSKNGYYYEGNFYITQDTRRGRTVGNGLTDSIPAKFKIDSDGSFNITQDNGFPTYRGFPTYTNQEIKIGDTWNAKAVRAIDPLNKGIVTKLPIHVQYKYIGDEVYNEEEVFVISAQWATRYGLGIGVNIFDWDGDKELVQGSGSHKANIYVSKETGNALVIHDMVDETFEYTDGNKYTFKGQISQFTEYPPAVDKYKVLKALEQSSLITKKDAEKLQDKDKNQPAAEKQNNTIDNNSESPDLSRKEVIENKDDTIWEMITTDSFDNPQDPPNKEDSDTTIWEQIQSDLFNNEDSSNTRQNHDKNEDILENIEENKNAPLVVVEETEAGLKLTLPNLQFLPNSAELVSGEKERLDKIAAALKEAGDARLLVEGHTARIGTIDDEMELSINRAHTIAQELIKRGIQSSNLICKGSGGSKPIADNKTPEGREKNRRVEITILE